jgi:hypothetical protein
MKWIQQIRQPIGAVKYGCKTYVSGPWSRFKNRLVGLRFAQRCYLLATVIWLWGLLLNTPNSLVTFIVFSLVVIGLAQEVFPKFMALWHLLPGKALILFIYAVVANFALANAAAMVNSLTGVSAQVLPYTHNFALILMVPGWFFISSVLGLILVQIFMPIYLITLLLLKPFSKRALWHDENYRYPLTTAVVRYAWLIALLVKMAVISEELEEMGYLPDENLNSSLVKINLGGEEKAELPAEESLTSETDDEIGNILSKISNYKSTQEKWLANFLFDYEADTKSRCAHPENSRVVEINDYEILLIEVDEESEVGYSYKVIRCESAAFGLGKLP